MNDKAVQRRLFSLILTTVLLLINLAIYLSLVITRALRGPWLYVVLAFILLTLGCAWSYSLARFITAVYKLSGSTTGPEGIWVDTTGTTGYAQPHRPIQVTMVGDEERLTEVRGASNTDVTIPPPAYGLWRSSVRLNPDLLYWQRVDHQSAVLRGVERDEGRTRKGQGRRVPSYMSNDGVDYVVEAQPRSFTANPRS
ncbi:hypothetical protein BJY04DRAFT_223962 [Aspergillus karnatakaensis]|uniref:uncharacterized protein n=1 Tax=Aspergillus karnatakaensis TaxID=1810916 RepID=UPI003CCD48DE